MTSFCKVDNEFSGYMPQNWRSGGRAVQSVGLWLAGIADSNPAGDVDVCHIECCLLLDRAITLPLVSYRLICVYVCVWCVCVCGLCECVCGV
jgi:hypothetical protein